ncbi:MAG TPA: hypothetical protein VHH36_07825, partial [Candidatus Thermoplasmatota archaeon]|nr:hypothetical protein [Candidatus Thermoplasmatota archaeon]
MGFTEVVYKIRSEGFPLCQFSETHSDVRAIVHTTSWDEDTRHHRALVTLVGPDHKIQQLSEALGQVYDRKEVVGSAKERLILKVSARLDTLKKTSNPAAFALDYFGDQAAFEPSLVKDGYLHARVLIVGKVDLADLLAHYERGVKEARWTDFKLIRIDDFDP